MIGTLTPQRAAELLLVAARNARILRSITPEQLETWRALNDPRNANPIHAAADAHLAKLSVAVRFAFAMGRKALGKNADVEAAATAIKKAVLEVLPSTLLKVLKSGGDAGVASLASLRSAEELRSAKGGIKPMAMRFDVTNPKAVEWAKAHAAELATGISDTTRKAIQDAVARAQEEGDRPELYADILAAVGDEARAEMIARTETMAAANEGNRQAWGQAEEAGLLTGDEHVEWIATDDACPECDALDGQLRDLDGEYPDDGGEGPPLHPNCRCTEGISAS